MTKNELKCVLAEHSKWLNDPSTGCKADLSGADLRNADLSGADLRNADLIGADLSGADLRNADLSGADLSGADLRNADLSAADLHEVNLIGVDLRNADMRNASLRNEDLRYCVGNGREVKSLQTGNWRIVFSAHVLAVGCQQHPISDWWEFDDATIAQMHPEALSWWKVWKPILKQIIEASNLCQ